MQTVVKVDLDYCCEKVVVEPSGVFEMSQRYSEIYVPKREKDEDFHASKKALKDRLAHGCGVSLEIQPLQVKDLAQHVS